jgi:hypothetical protein
MIATSPIVITVSATAEHDDYDHLRAQFVSLFTRLGYYTGQSLARSRPTGLPQDRRLEWLQGIII